MNATLTGHLRIVCLCLALAAVAAGCPAEADKALGELCASNAECINGFCYEGTCSRTSDDLDGDCIPNVDDTVVDDPEELRQRICMTAGVCASAVVRCPATGTAPFCSYEAVVGYEPDGETKCDFVDNDCDGEIDNVGSGVVCCQADLDCDDGDRCTTEVCGNNNSCTYEAVNSLLCTASCLDELAALATIGPNAFGQVYDVSVGQTRAYVATDFGIAAVDVSSPASPTLLWEHAIATQGARVLVEEGSVAQGVLLADVEGHVTHLETDAMGTVNVAGEFDAGGPILDMVSSDDGSLVIGTSTAIEFWGLSGVTPSKMAASLVADWPSALARTDVGLTVAAGDLLTLVDVSGLPASAVPVATEQLTDFETISAIVGVGTTLVVFGASVSVGGHVAFLDVSDPAAGLVPAGGFNHGERIEDAVLSTDGTTIYLQTPSGVAVMPVDPTDVANSTITSTVSIPGIQGAALNADALALAVGDGGLVVRALAALSDDAQGSTTNPPRRALDVAVLEDHAYVAMGNGGLTRLQVTDPTAVDGAAASTFATEYGPIDALHVMTVGVETYLVTRAPAGEVKLLHVVDASTDPLEAATIEPPPANVPKGVAGNASSQLFIANGAAGVDIYDVSQPSVPQLQETIAPPGLGSAEGVAARGSRLYMAAGDVGVVVYSSTPGAVAPLGTLPAPGGTTTAVAVDQSNNRLAAVVLGDDLSENADRLIIVDVTNGASPELVETVSMQTGLALGHSLAWSDSYVAVAARQGGVWLVGDVAGTWSAIDRRDTPGDVRGVAWGPLGYLLAADDLSVLTVLEPGCSTP